jgi:hypothetical protein
VQSLPELRGTLHGVNLACVQCAKPLVGDAKFCASCGRPTDADGDGIPDALDKLIENKAKSILAAERQGEADQRAKEALAEEITKLERADVTIGEQIQQNQRIPRSWWALLQRQVIGITSVCAVVWAIVGWLPHLAILPLISYTPAGFVACPLQCETCSGPGRAFSWNFKGSWRSEKGQMGYALVCHNPKYDVDKLDERRDVRGALNAELQPYMVSSFFSFFVEGAMFCAAMSLYFGVFRLGKRRRKLDAMLAALELNRSNGRARLTQLRGDRLEPTTPFRS